MDKNNCYNLIFLNGIFESFDVEKQEDSKENSSKQIAENKENKRSSVLKNETDGVTISFKNTLDKPLWIQYRYSANADQTPVSIKNTFHVEKDVALQAFESHINLDTIASQPIDLITGSDFFLKKRSKVEFLSLIENRPCTSFSNEISVFSEEESSFKGFSFSSKNLYEKTKINLNLLKTKAQAELCVLSFLKEKEIHTIEINVNHLAPETTSKQSVSCVLDGASKSTTSGLLKMVQGAKGSAASQLNKNLLLSSSVKATSKPYLEILEDEVKCSHGVASGSLNAEDLFYLQSRGLNFVKARKILSDAYLVEGLNRFELNGFFKDIILDTIKKLEL